jgi:plasmid replication initiation protein
MEKIVEVQHPNGNWEMFNIINYARYNKRQGSVTLEINKRAEPYLLKLQELFTSYELINILDLESKYSIRLYQIMKGSLYKKELIYLLQDFKDTLKINKKTYEAYNNINRFIITPCLKEINSKTDINVSFIAIKEGRKVVGLKFSISSKKVLDKKINKKEKIIKSSNNFNNFEAREYDYNKLEADYLDTRKLVLAM